MNISKFKFAFIGILAIVALIATVGCQATPEDSSTTLPADPADSHAAATQTIDAARGQAELNRAATQAAEIMYGTATPTPHAPDVNALGGATDQPAPTALPGSTQQPQPTPIPGSTTAPVPPTDQNALLSTGLTPFTPTRDAAHGMWDRPNLVSPFSDNCYRAWQAVGALNGTQNDPWLILHCDMASSGSIDLVHDVPGHYTLSGNGELSDTVVLDVHAMEELTNRGVSDPEDPYITAVVGDPNYSDSFGLGLYIKGQGQVMDIFGRWVDISECAFIQVQLPKDMWGGWIIRLKVSGGAMTFWTGALEPAQCGYACQEVTPDNLFALTFKHGPTR